MLFLPLPLLRTALFCTGIVCLFGCGNPAPEQPSEPQSKQPGKTVEKKAEKPAEVAPTVHRIPKGKAGQFFKNYAAEHPEDQVIIKTRLGDITIRLYKDTPMHRANFIFLAEHGFMDQTLFYRIEKGFMVQGGGTDDESVVQKRNVLGKYRVPAEILPKYYHKRGAVAMARNYKDNPKKESSEFNFYIVQGQTYTPGELKSLEKEYDIKVPAHLRSTYQTVGGAPHLDGQHTVFGEVISGMDVVDKMAELPVDDGGWPYDDVSMDVDVLAQKP